MRALLSEVRSDLERQLKALDAAEGYPKQGSYVTGRPPPKGKGITETSGVIVRHPARAEYALQLKPEPLLRHGGKSVRVDGADEVVKRESELVELDGTWTEKG